METSREDLYLLFLIILFILIILDEIITEWFIYYDFGEERNPIMKSKITRIISVPIMILLMLTVYYLGFIQEIIFIVCISSFMFLIAFYFTVIISNIITSLIERSKMKELLK